jgi:RND family efflux transporter MFP subunit
MAVPHFMRITVRFQGHRRHNLRTLDFHVRDRRDSQLAKGIHMFLQKLGIHSRFVVIASVVGVLLLCGTTVWVLKNGSGEIHANEHEQMSEITQVHVVKPLAGGLERLTTQPVTVRAFEYEELFAKVSGFLKVRTPEIDIDSVVKEGEVLAEIDAPELLKAKKHAEACVEQAKAKVEEMHAHIGEAEAARKAAEFLVTQRRAEIHRAKASLDFYSSQYDRYYKLIKEFNAIDYKLLEEAFKQREAAQAWKDATEAAVNTADADVEAKKAQVIRAKADLSGALANQKVAEAALEKAEVYVGFTKIRSHYNGVVTKRYFHKGSFIRDPEHGGVTPVFTIQRTDLMRLVIQVPDADAGFADPGDPVDVTFPTLPDDVKEFRGLKISRTSRSQDESSRTRRVEIDFPNPNNLVRDGMYGDATIHLQAPRKDAVRVPASCVHRDGHRSIVFVVRKPHDLIRIVPVAIGINDGNTAEIVTGIGVNDLVVQGSPEGLREGTIVKVVEE